MRREPDAAEVAASVTAPAAAARQPGDAWRREVLVSLARSSVQLGDGKVSERFRARVHNARWRLWHLDQSAAQRAGEAGVRSAAGAPGATGASGASGATGLAGMVGLAGVAGEHDGAQTQINMLHLFCGIPFARNCFL